MGNAVFASALSTQSDSAAAIREIESKLGAEFGSETPDLLAVFVSHHHGTAIETLGPVLSRSLGARVVIGCTGESIVGDRREIERGPALSVWAGALPGTRLVPLQVQATQNPEGGYSFSCLPRVRDVARASLLLLADPFTFPMAEYLDHLNQKIPGLPAFGGMASGGRGPGQNILLSTDGVVESGAVGLLIEGDIEVCSIVSQGCRPVGKPLVITACKDHFILKLGGKPAVQALMEMMQELSAEDRGLLQNGPLVGLAIDARKSSFERGDFLARGLHGLEPKQGALMVDDPALRVGQTIQFLARDKDTAGEDLTHLMRARVQADTGKLAATRSTGALVFSCNGRGTRLFGRPDHDITCIQSAFQSHVPAAGFFAMGEIGPVGGRNFLHGFTASVAVFRPRASETVE